MPSVLLDTGPLVAYLCPRDSYHDWAVDQFAAAQSSFLTCEAVLTETCFLVARYRQPPMRVLELTARGLVRIALDFEDNVKPIQALMQRYANVPMSFADACLVRMTEMTALPVCTLDSDFTIYRKHGRTAPTLLHPTM